MQILNLLEEERQKVLDFLVPYEKYCVTLMSEILHGSKSVFVLKNHFGEIRGVFSWFMGSTIHHCLPELNGKNQLETEEAFKKFFQEHSLNYLFSISGEKTGTDMFARLLNDNFIKRPSKVVDYYLMENGRFDSKKNLSGMNQQLEISVCKLSEANKIFKIQADYEKEEVIIDGEEFNEELSRAKFENLVEAGAVYIGTINKCCLTKLSVTGTGLNYGMLGGVYTVPRYRNHGLAKAMVNYISEDFARQNKKLTLFVKQKNLPAIKVYEDCGFKKLSGYKTLYYQKDYN